MKKILLFAFALFSLCANAQYAAQYNDGAIDWYTKYQITNSGPGGNNSVLLRRNAYDLPDSGKHFRIHTTLQLDTVIKKAQMVTGSKYLVINDTGMVGWRTSSYNFNPGRTLVTTAAAANGFQVSATRDADIRYSITITSSVSLSGNSAGYAVIEICPTNSTTASDWIEVARTPSGQSGTLVVGLVLNQVGGGQISTPLPPGYYARIRTVATAGTPTFAINSQVEKLM